MPLRTIATVLNGRLSHFYREYFFKRPWISFPGIFLYVMWGWCKDISSSTPGYTDIFLLHNIRIFFPYCLIYFSPGYFFQGCYFRIYFSRVYIFTAYHHYWSNDRIAQNGQGRIYLCVVPGPENRCELEKSAVHDRPTLQQQFQLVKVHLRWVLDEQSHCPMSCDLSLDQLQLIILVEVACIVKSIWQQLKKQKLCKYASNILLN